MAPGLPDLLAGEQLPPAPKQERSRRKRDALLRSALELFGALGYEETSIEAIARQAGVAVGGFYQHFASKRQVLLVLMDRLLREISAFSLQPADAASGDMRSLIHSLVQRGLQVDWAYAGAYRAWREAAALDPALRAYQQQMEQWTANLLEMLFQALQQAPGARQDVNIPRLAEVLSALFWRLAEVPLDEPDDVIASVTDLIYHALFID